MQSRLELLGIVLLAGGSACFAASGCVRSPPQTSQVTDTPEVPAADAIQNATNVSADVTALGLKTLGLARAILGGNFANAAIGAFGLTSEVWRTILVPLAHQGDNQRLGACLETMAARLPAVSQEEACQRASLDAAAFEADLGGILREMEQIGQGNGGITSSYPAYVRRVCDLSGDAMIRSYCTGRPTAAWTGREQAAEGADQHAVNIGKCVDPRWYGTSPAEGLRCCDLFFGQGEASLLARCQERVGQELGQEQAGSDAATPAEVEAPQPDGAPVSTDTTGDGQLPPAPTADPNDPYPGYVPTTFPDWPGAAGGEGEP